jgi:hypothetical protein
MATWTKDKNAHIDTWFSLFRLKQIQAPFDTSGTIRMSELTFYNPLSSPEFLRIEATLLANTIDTVFTSWGAKLENNISRNTAIFEMIEILLDKDKTILDLAEVNDKNYFFHNEK